MTDDIKALRDAINEPQRLLQHISLVAACSPDRIARLLDALEAAQKDAKRYRALREKACQKTAHDIYGNGCLWQIGLYCDDSRKSFDAAIDAAMAQAHQ